MPPALYPFLLIALIMAGLFSLPIVLGFLAGLWETRLVWPYVTRVDQSSRADATNPYAAPGQDDPVPISDYAIAVNREAESRGFRPLGRFFDGKGKIYKLRYDFWIEPDDLVLVMVGGGTLAGIPLQATWMFTRRQDGGALVTLDDPKGGDSDPTGMTDQVILANADFAELLERHHERIATGELPAIPYSETEPLIDHRRFRAARADALVEQGWARYLDDEQNRYKYTVKGALLAAVRSSLKEWRRAVRDRSRQQIARPGQPGYTPSATRGAESPAWMDRLRVVCWAMIMVGLISSFSKGPARSQAQLLFRTLVPLAGFGGLILLWMLRRDRRKRAAADEEEYAST